MRYVLSAFLLLTLAVPCLAGMVAVRDKVTGHIYITHPEGTTAADDIAQEAAQSGLDAGAVEVVHITPEQMQAQMEKEKR